MEAARIRIQLLDGEAVVHEFNRSTTLHLEGGIQRMCEAAMGWLQAYSGQVTNEQWQKDATRVRSPE